MRHLVDELREAYQAGRQHTDPLDDIEVIRAPEAIAARFNELQRSVEREMLVFSKPAGHRQHRGQRRRAGARPAPRVEEHV